MKSARMTAAAIGISLSFLGSAIAEDATVVAPNHYKVEFENDKVRVIRITYGPGEEAAMHEHPDAVLVNLSNFTVQFTLADGAMPPAEPATAGSVAWAAAAMHSAKNVGSGRAEALLIEIKD